MRYALLLLGVFIVSSRIAVAEFVLASPETKAEIVVGSDEPEFVRVAVCDLIGDVEKITGQTLSLVEKAGEGTRPRVVVRTEKSDAWERYTVRTTSDTTLEITGSDAHGTMFGVYEFLETFVGVDPLYYWKDREPKKRKRIAFDSVDCVGKSPTVRFRGWFVNDEDLLTKWRDGGGTREIDYPFYGQVVHEDVMERVVEALVRCRFNTIIPGSFIDIMNPAEEKLVRIAARRGVWISQHHIEPVGVSAFAFFNYWKRKNGTKPLFSWYGSKKELLEVWEKYIRKWSTFPNVVWQIGLRGIADRPMWLADPNVPQSDAERGAIISDAMKTQVELIRKYDPRPNPPMTATLWMEGSMLLRRGYLAVPRGTILVFSDNSPGWKMQDDFYSVPRDGKYRYGMYYHHQLWGSGPHLAQGVSPKRTAIVLREALEFPATDFVICNVSNIREFVLGIDATAQMLRDLKTFDPDAYMRRWCRANFGPRSDEVKALYDDYFAAFAIDPATRTPFMLDGQLASKGRGVLKTVVRCDFKRGETPRKTTSRDPKPVRVEQDDRPIRPGAAAPSRERSNMSEEQKVIHGIMSDALPPDLGPNANLYASLYQKERFDSVLQRARKLATEMAPEHARFLETNLIAPAAIMSSLSGWAAELFRARLAIATGDAADVRPHIQTALDELAGARVAVGILTRGERWRYWYRGEEKLGLSRLNDETRNALKENNNQGMESGEKR